MKKIEIYELKYKVDRNKNYIKLLGDEFLNNNKLRGYYIYNQKKFRLDKRIETKNITKDRIKIKIIFLVKIYNKKFMFKECRELLNYSMLNEKEINYSKDSNISIINEIDKEDTKLFDIFSKNENDNFNDFYDEISDKGDNYSKEKDKSIFYCIKDNLNNLKENHYNNFICIPF